MTLIACENVPGGEERGETDVFAGYDTYTLDHTFYPPLPVSQKCMAATNRQY